MIISTIYHKPWKALAIGLAALCAYREYHKPALWVYADLAHAKWELTTIDRKLIGDDSAQAAAARGRIWSQGVLDGKVDAEWSRVELGKLRRDLADYGPPVHGMPKHNFEIDNLHGGGRDRLAHMLVSRTKTLLIQWFEYWKPSPREPVIPPT